MNGNIVVVGVVLVDDTVVDDNGNLSFEFVVVGDGIVLRNDRATEQVTSTELPKNGCSFSKLSQWIQEKFKTLFVAIKHFNF